MELELVAAIGVVMNGLVAQALAFFAARHAITAQAAAQRATLTTLPGPVVPPG
jgi:hypothetical protein